MDSHVSIIHDSLVRNRDCFLSSLVWDLSISSLPSTTIASSLTNVQVLLYRTFRLMTQWPTFVRELTNIRCRDSLAPPRHSPCELLWRAESVAEELSDIGLYLDRATIRSGTMKLKKATDMTGPVEQAYHFTDTSAALAYCYHGLYSLVMQLIISSLKRIQAGCAPPSQHQEHTSLTTLCERTWMLNEYSQHNAPLGLVIYPSALALTFDCTECYAIKGWIIERLNELYIRQGLKAEWTEEKVKINSMLFTGRFG